MYKLKLVYSPEPRTQTLKETITYCACMDLYTHLNIESYQTSATVLEFESHNHRLLATVWLSSSSSFTVQWLD